MLSSESLLDLNRYNAKLHINKKVYDAPFYVIDCETDEKDNFVGIGVTSDGINIHYYTTLDVHFLENNQLVGHNLKADIKWLKMWGVDIAPEQIYGDTMLMSYCQDPTREKHGLKSLAKSIASIEYPDYKSIVGKGRNKVTLDKQPIETTANYCGHDVLATYRLYKHFNEKLTSIQKSLYENLELPVMRLLYQMELLGIRVDIKYLTELQTRFQDDIESIKSQIDTKINLNSPVQVKAWLKSKGIIVTSTDKKVLSGLKQNKCLEQLSEYRELTKLKSTYVDALLEKNKDEIIHTTFSQLIDTGRLSSYGPNIQNIPTRSQRGDLLRNCFIPRKGCIFIDADYSQIEYRLLAHFTKEPSLIKAFKEGKDVHETTANLLGVSRYLGKTLNFASIYGAQPKKIAQTVNSSGEEHITEEQAEDFLNKYWAKLPMVKYWVEKTKDEARRNGAFKTLSGQYYKLKYIYDANKFKRWFSERQAVNGTIQGSAAYIIKLAMLQLAKRDIFPLIQVHDELLFEFPESKYVDEFQMNIKEIMENVVKLDVPLEISIGTGYTWKESKK